MAQKPPLALTGGIMICALGLAAGWCGGRWLHTALALRRWTPPVSKDISKWRELAEKTPAAPDSQQDAPLVLPATASSLAERLSYWLDPRSAALAGQWSLHRMMVEDIGALSEAECLELLAALRGRGLMETNRALVEILLVKRMVDLGLPLPPSVAPISSPTSGGVLTGPDDALWVSYWTAQVKRDPEAMTARLADATVSEAEKAHVARLLLFHALTDARPGAALEAMWEKIRQSGSPAVVEMAESQRGSLALTFAMAHPAEPMPASITLAQGSAISMERDWWEAGLRAQLNGGWLQALLASGHGPMIQTWLQESAILDPEGFRAAVESDDSRRSVAEKWRPALEAYARECPELFAESYATMPAALREEFAKEARQARTALEWAQAVMLAKNMGSAGENSDLLLGAARASNDPAAEQWLMSQLAEETGPASGARHAEAAAILAEKNPQAAWDSARTPIERQAVARAWSSHDPAAAAEAAAIAGDPALAAQAAGWWAAQDPSAAMDFVRRLPASAQEQGLAEWAAQVAPAQAAAALTSWPQVAASAVQETAQRLGDTDPQAAENWIASLSGEIQTMAMSGYVEGTVTWDPLGTSEWLAAQAAGPGRDRAILALVRGLPDDPEGTAAWAAQIQSPDLAAEAQRIIAQRTQPLVETP